MNDSELLFFGLVMFAYGAAAAAIGAHIRRRLDQRREFHNWSYQAGMIVGGAIIGLGLGAVCIVLGVL